MKLSEFLDGYQDNDNEWFALDHGEAQNMFDAAVESVAVLGARAERAEAERDAALAEVARLRKALADVLAQHDLAELRAWSGIGTTRGIEIMLMVSEEWHE